MATPECSRLSMMAIPEHSRLSMVTPKHSRLSMMSTPEPYPLGSFQDSIPTASLPQNSVLTSASLSLLVPFASGYEQTHLPSRPCPPSKKSRLSSLPSDPVFGSQCGDVTLRPRIFRLSSSGS